MQQQIPKLLIQIKLILYSFNLKLKTLICFLGFQFFLYLEYNRKKRRCSKEENERDCLV